MSQAEIIVIMIMFHSSNHKCLKLFYLHEICLRHRHLSHKTVSYNRFTELEKSVVVQIEHSRDRSFTNFIVNLIEGIAACGLFPKKPMINLNRGYDNRLTLFWLFSSNSRQLVSAPLPFSPLTFCRLCLIFIIAAFYQISVQHCKTEFKILRENLKIRLLPV